MRGVHTFGMYPETNTLPKHQPLVGDCSRNGASRDMPFKDFLSSILPVKAAYPDALITVAITGGEPLLRDDLAECGRALTKNGFGWGIVTNGYVYGPDVQKSLLDAGMGAVSVSIDGLEESHNRLRGDNDSFHRAVNAVKIIAPFVHRLSFDVITCVSPLNLEELPRLKDLFVSLGIPAWRLFTIAPIGRAKDNPSLRLSPQEKKRLLDFIAASREEFKSGKPMEVKFGCEAYTGSYEEKVRSSRFFCRAGVNIASVLNDGSIAACPNISRDFIQGNIYHNSLIETWYKGYEPFRNRRWTRKVAPCASCKEYPHCLGGAMHLWNDKDGGLMECLFSETR